MNNPLTAMLERNKQTIESLVVLNFDGRYSPVIQKIRELNTEIGKVIHLKTSNWANP